MSWERQCHSRAHSAEGMAGRSLVRPSDALWAEDEHAQERCGVLAWLAWGQRSIHFFALADSVTGSKIQLLAAG